MNATPTNINPVNSTPPAPGRQQDATTPDTPFSRVLSSEMAQNRSSQTAREGDDAKAGADDVPPSASPLATGPDATEKSVDAGEAAAVPQQTADNPALPDALIGLALPDALPGLAMTPDALQTAFAGMRVAQGTQDARPGSPDTEPTNAPNLLDPRKGRGALLQQSGQGADKAAGSRKNQPSLPDMAGVEAATPSPRTGATGLPEMPTARQADAMKAGEFLGELMTQSALRAAPHGAPALDPLAAGKLAPSVGATAWGQALGEKIVWMAAGAQQSASLTLNPPNLGPLQIVLNITNDQATASFFSAQPEVRQALEAAFPKLREMMNDAGIQLGQATVSADTPRQNDTPERQSQRVASAFIDAGSATASELPAQTSIVQSGRGLIDTFA